MNAAYTIDDRGHLKRNGKNLSCPFSVAKSKVLENTILRPCGNWCPHFLEIKGGGIRLNCVANSAIYVIQIGEKHAETESI